MPRHIKRLIIIAVYILIVFSLIFWMWSGNRTPGSCSDGKKNQNEQAIDCGGVCDACIPVVKANPFEIESVTMVVGGQDRYDVIARITNPNSLYGARSIPYAITLKGADGSDIERIEGVSFALPNQTRYIAELNIPSSVIPQRAEIEIGANIDWIKFTDFEDPDFVVDGSRFGLAENGINYAQAFGIVHNRSTFDFQNVGVIVIIKDASGRPLAVNKTQMGDFTASRQRDFNLAWPYQFPGTMASMDVEVEANVYDSQNFIKKFGENVTDLSR